jgi:ATP-binding cassette subfamily B (MDR/TAP) protein 1
VEPSVSTIRILQLNKKELPYNIIACITAAITGCSMPLFSIIFGDIIGVRNLIFHNNFSAFISNLIFFTVQVLSEPDADKVRSDTNIYCIYFVLAGIVIGLTSFIQVY